MKRNSFILITLSLLFALNSVNSTLCHGQTKKEERVEMEIGINREHRDVGLKRMELIDKALSRELVERKRALVQKIEQDYNTKILQIINSIIPELFKNKVLTHLDVNFFAPDFETQIHASQKASVSIIIARDGFNTWAAQNSSEQSALTTLKQLINTTFKIPHENISILIVN